MVRNWPIAEIACLVIVAHMKPEAVCDRDTFIRYLNNMRMELANTILPDEWVSPKLAGFLEAMEAWVTDDGQSPPDNPWQFAAILLCAAKSYE